MKFVLTADLHLRETVPGKRSDDYRAAQNRKFQFILEICKKHKAVLLVAGDFGNKPEWPNILLSRTIKQIKESGVVIISTFGQHDLPFHNLEKWEESGLSVLVNTGVVRAAPFQNYFFFGDTVVSCCPYGVEPKGDRPELRKRGIRTSILVMHKMVIKEPLWPGQKAHKAHRILKKHNYNLILTGDNHKGFTETHGDRFLVNPGSMMRMTSDQRGARPRTYIYDTDTRTLERVNLPIERNVFKRERINKDDKQKERVAKFIKQLKKHKRITESFIQNVKNWLQTYPQGKRVKKKIWEAIEHGKSGKKVIED